MCSLPAIMRYAPTGAAASELAGDGNFMKYTALKKIIHAHLISNAGLFNGTIFDYFATI